MGAVGSLKPKKSSTNIHLLPRHRQVADEYLANGLNAAAAARKCGYSNPWVLANKIFSRPEVRKYVEGKLAEIQEQQYLRRHELLAKMKRVNDFNLMLAVVNSKGGKLEIDQERWEEVAYEIGDAVTEMEFNTFEHEDGTVETRARIKLMDKDKNFDRELTYFGIKDLDGNVTVNIGGPQVDFDALCSPPRNDDVIEGLIEGKGVKK